MSAVQGLENLLLQYWRPATDLVEREADAVGKTSWSAQVIHVDNDAPYVDLTARDTETLKTVAAIYLRYKEIPHEIDVANAHNVITINIHVNDEEHFHVVLPETCDTAQEVVDGILAFRL